MAARAREFQEQIFFSSNHHNKEYKTCFHLALFIFIVHKYTPKIVASIMCIHVELTCV